MDTSLAEQQRQLTDYIRNPDVAGIPPDIEARRAKIYGELFYNNIDSFISSGFPVLRSLIDDQLWQQMVRDFMVHHRCHTPYFLEIGQEFLLYLQQTRQQQAQDLPFMFELAHYEWVELALDVADADIAAIDVDDEINLLEKLPIVSPLAWSLVYSYPVNRIGPGFVPESAPAEPTYLVVYRNRQDKVEFMQANAVTARLLELLQSNTVATGREALTQLAVEMQHADPKQLLDSGEQLLQKLHALDIILGVQSR